MQVSAFMKYRYSVKLNIVKLNALCSVWSIPVYIKTPIFTILQKRNAMQSLEIRVVASTGGGGGGGENTPVFILVNTKT